jgi:hypothetical protein
MQENENYRQRGFGTSLDTVLSNYRRMITSKNACEHLVIRYGDRKRFSSSSGWFR